jgi:serine/threonine protein kinase
MKVASAPRWVEVTPSPFPHEAEGLRLVREVLPQTSPYRAWSNVEFRDGQGKWHEVDLIVLGQRRLHLVELKYYSGTLRGDDLRWLRDGHRAEDSPLKLARRKAQRLASKLRDELIRWAEETGAPLQDVRDVVPFVQECVFLHHPRLRSHLPVASQIDVFGLDGHEDQSGLPGISTRLLEASTATQSVGPNKEDILAVLMKRIGLVQRRQREVGSWVVDDEPIGDGDGWQDWSASHRLVGSDRARIRVRVVPPGAPAAEAGRVRTIVEHEYKVMRRLTHDGVLRPRDFVDDELGVGLVYPHDEAYQRLDLYQADHPQGLPLADQLSMLRQVAEALSYAHGHRVVHRGLTPAAIWVKALAGGGVHVLVGDWQSVGSATGEQLTGLSSDGVTALAAAEATVDRLGLRPTPTGVDVDRRRAEVFEAPEGVWSSKADRVRLDVFALGAIAYTVLAGRPPATDRLSQRERVQRDQGLDIAADLPQISSAMRSLVLEATRPSVSERLPDMGAFLDRLAAVERGVSDPDDVVDPLSALAGAVLDDRWQLERRLGAGSTAVGLLVSDLSVGTGTEAQRVLKVALNDAAEARLEAEAAVLKVLSHPRIVRILDGPITVGNRRALVLESAGDQTLADVMTARQRLSLDLLDRWGRDLLEILRQLDKSGVDHRDIKPANLGVREGRSDRAKHLVLFDFSLTRAGATAVTAGTPPYLDPFLDTPGRGRYDSAAERYAVAVVLYEMATGRTPVYGDGVSNPAAIADEATLSTDQFDPALAEAGVVAFFERALARSADARHDTVQVMLDEWSALFTPAATTVPDDADARAAAATAQTLLRNAGLSARGLSAIEHLGVVTVGDLVATDPVRLNRLTGASEPSRREVKQRAKEWRTRLGTAVIGRTTGSRLVEAGHADATSMVGALLDALGAAGSGSRRRAAELVLGVDSAVGAFATQEEVGHELGVTRARVAQLVGEMQDLWSAEPGTQRILDDVLGRTRTALVELGGVATADELVGALHLSVSAGASGTPGTERLAAGLVRAALERSDALERADADSEPLARGRRHGRLIVAVDATLIDVVASLGQRADTLVSAGSQLGVVTAARAAAALRTADAPLTATADLGDSRLVQLAAAASQNARLSGRGELYREDLPLVDASRLALSGVTGVQPLPAQEIRDRVRARFPALPGLPERPRLDNLLSEAGLGLRYDDGERAFRSLTAVGETTGVESRVVTRVVPPGAPLSLSGGHLDTRLGESMTARSFLALGVDAVRAERVADALRERYAATCIDVTGVLLDALRQEAAGRIDWDVVVAADAQPRGTRAADGLSALVTAAVPAVAAAVEQAFLEHPGSPVVLTEASTLARYDRLAALSRWTDLAQPRQAAVWLLVPQLPGNTGALLDGRPVPLAAPGQFIRVGEDWLAVSAGTPA